MAKKKGAGDYFIGATSTTYGSIQSYDEDDNTNLVKSFDEDGQADGVAKNDDVLTVTMEIQVDIAVSLPAVGDTLAVTTKQYGSKNVIVQNVKLGQRNNEYTTATVTGEHYPVNGIPT